MTARIATTCGLLFTLAIPFPITAQRVSVDANLHASDRPYVQATGEAIVSVKPDQALIEIGVITQGPTATAVAALNAQQTDAVLAEIRKALGASDRVKTTSYSVRPDFQTPKPGGRVTIGGYSARNVVEVTLNDLTRVGKVIDAATQSGANTIQTMEYKLKDSRAVQGQALREAAAQAKAWAEAIAAGLSLRVLRVLSAEEAVSDEEFGYKKKAAPPPVPQGAVAPTPIVEPAAIEIEARVMLRVEVGQ